MLKGKSSQVSFTWNCYSSLGLLNYMHINVHLYVLLLSFLFFFFLILAQRFKNNIMTQFNV